MLESATDAFAYLTGSFHRSDGYIFASARSALTYGLSPFDRRVIELVAYELQRTKNGFRAAVFECARLA